MKFYFTEKGYVFNFKNVIYENFVSFFDTKDFYNSLFELLRKFAENEEQAKDLLDSVHHIVKQFDEKKIVTRAEFARRINVAFGGL